MDRGAAMLALAGPSRGSGRRKGVGEMFDKMLLAVDGSEPSKRAVHMTAELALKLGAEVVVLHVQERMAGRAGAFDLEITEEAADLLDEAMAELKDAGVSVASELQRGIYGHAARVIVEVAESSGADLIVMGSRGLTEFGAMFLGSVTHKVLHIGDRAVLVVH
jgi:nucleotide-binding universal stress UspA family protein